MEKHGIYPLIKPVMILIAAMVSIQTGASFAKQLFPIFGAAGVAALRLCFATAILCAVTRPWRFRFTREGWMALLWYGLSMGGMNLMIYLSLQHIPLGVAIALEFTGPLGVAVLASHRRLDLAWVALAAMGILLLLPHGNDGTLSLAGIMLALGAGICWGLYIIFGQRAGHLAPSGAIAAIGMVFAALLVAPAGIVMDGSRLTTLPYWPAALMVAILSSALPYYLEMIALKALPTRTFGVLMSMEPAIAACSGLMILHEHLSSRQWAAILCIIMASAGAVASAEKTNKLPELNV